MGIFQTLQMVGVNFMVVEYSLPANPEKGRSEKWKINYVDHLIGDSTSASCSLHEPGRPFRGVKTYNIDNLFIYKILKHYT